MSETSRRVLSENEAREEARRGRRITQERIEELAEYYDRTDTADLEGEDVTDQGIIMGPEDMEQVSIRLPKEDLDLIKRRAKAAGVGYTTMIRMIVHAHLKNPLTY